MKKMIYAIIAGLMSVAVISTLIYYYSGQSISKPLSNEQRAILLNRFEATVSEDTDTPLKRVIDHENPVNVITYYGNDDVTALWNAIPEDIQAISILLIIPSNVMMPGASTEMMLEAAKACEQNEIPFIVQIANGETHKEWLLPVSYIQETFSDMTYYYGLSMAEIYNGEEWRGELNGDHAMYITEIIEYCGDDGLFFFWTDTNIFGDNGTIVDWIEENEQLYSAMKDNYDHIIMQNKESYGDASTYSLMKGLYLAKLIGGWGVATDWWHWQVSHYKSLFDVSNGNIDNEWERIYYYPEAMQTQSLMFVMSSGGFAFKNEAQFYSVAVNGKRSATFEYLTIPFFRQILSGRFDIPSREEVLRQTQVAIVGGSNYRAVGYDDKISTLYPVMPDYGIVPLLPSNLRKEEAALFDANGITLIEEAVDEQLLMPFSHSGIEGDTFLAAAHNQWFFLNSSENKDQQRYGLITDTGYEAVESMRIQSSPHTFVMMSAGESGIDIHMNNLRLDKREMIDSLDGTEAPMEALEQWITVTDEMPLPKSGLEEPRTTVIEFRMAEDYSVPDIKILNETNELMPIKLTEIFDEEMNVLKIEISHNGPVDLLAELGTVTWQQMKENDISKSTESDNRNGKDQINETVAKSNLQTLVNEWRSIADSHGIYSETSLHHFRKVYGKAEQVLLTGNAGEAGIEILYEDLVQAHGLLIDISKHIDLLKETLIFMEEGQDYNDLQGAYDNLLRECLAPGLYYQGKDNDLRFRFYRKVHQYDDTLHRKKIKALEDAFVRLSGALNSVKGE